MEKVHSQLSVELPAPAREAGYKTETDGQGLTWALFHYFYHDTDIRSVSAAFAVTEGLGSLSPPARWHPVPLLDLGADLILPARTGTSLCIHSHTGSGGAGAAGFKEEGRAGGPICRVRAVSCRDEEGGRSCREGCREVVEQEAMRTHQSRA